MAKERRSEALPSERWERQDGESAQAFEGFALYRDMGAERSLAKVAQELGKSKALMERWSVRWQWGQRAEAWDAEFDRMVRRALEKGIIRMRRQHVDIAQAMLMKALEALELIPPAKMTPKDIAVTVDVASKLERLSRGEATERTEGKQVIAGEINFQKVDLSNVSDEELAMLDEITEKILAE